jgi:hypothetical protein
MKSEKEWSFDVLTDVMVIADYQPAPIGIQQQSHC